MISKPSIPVTIWEGCYEQRWNNRIVPGAFVHPAKISKALLIRIYNHLLDQGLLHRHETILDPFSGIGTTAIEGANRGIRVIGVELEPKFVELARENVDKHRRYWEGMEYPIPILLQGDSRKLRQILADAGIDAVISSPPFLMSRSDTKRSVPTTHGGPAQERHHTTQDGVGYGDTPGNLELFKAGSVEAVISSPPYAEIATGAGGLNTHPPKHEGQQAGRSASSASQDTDQRYGETAGQLAQMEKGDVDAVVSSPPYAGSLTQGNTSEGYDYTHYGGGGQLASSQRYGDSEGQLETLPSGNVDAVVCVPPYEGRVNDKRKMGGGIDWTKVAERTSGPNSQGRNPFRYGRGEGQMGAEEGETFWTAAQQVVRECYALLKPGGVAVWVVKAFVREKQRIDFPGDWRTLCEHEGFTTVEEIHALFAKEKMVKGKLVTVERKSFFRRLAEGKGSPRIDWEVIWVMTRCH